MSYRFSVARPVKRAVPSIAAEQLDAARLRLSSAGGDETAIHAVRRHFKRTRALLDLVKSGPRGKSAKNSGKLLSSAAKMLSASRDAQVAVGAAEALEKEFGARRSRLFADLKAWLRARRDLAEEKLAHSQLECALEELAKAKESLAKLDLKRAGIEDLLKSASKTYRRGRHAMKAALAASEDDEALHTWRKQVQRHWRHTLLFAQAWPKEARARTKLARKLSNDLGQHHDLAVLREMILANRAAFRSARDVRTLCACIKAQQAELVSEAASRGECLYAEKPKAFLKRLRISWQNAKQKHAGKAVAA